MNERYFAKDYFKEYPTFPEELVHYLIKKKIKMIGVDICSVDHETFTAHKLFLQNDILIIENLTNLEAIEAKQFTVYAFPLKLSLDGSPLRVIAEINK
jgi:kynurenine formamidase